MNCWELKALPLRLCCDVCGEPIGSGDRYYGLPDGCILCAEGDCLSGWAERYRLWGPEEGAMEE